MTNQHSPAPDWLTAPDALHPSDDRTFDSLLAHENPGPRELVAFLADRNAAHLERLAHRAQALTRRHFGRTIALYAPLYLSNFCSSGCVYCGFASDRRIPRARLAADAIEREITALKRMGIEEVLLLTGERTPQADFEYLLQSVRQAAPHFAAVTIETFPMTGDEYALLVDAGCTGVTIYQETYDPVLYPSLHRWGAKRDFRFRLDAPERALRAGFRTAGLGVLLGLGPSTADAVALLRHIIHLRRVCWQAGLSVSFPRLRPQTGGFQPAHPVDDAGLARLICAMRICLPDVHLTLSTRETPAFRDGMAGIGISKMSVASRTTVGGYGHADHAAQGQFEVADARTAEVFCDALRARGLEPVFKNWDRLYRGAEHADS